MKVLKGSKLLFLVGIISVAYGAFLVLNFIITLEDIKNRNLVYDTDIGWINLTHCLPSGPRKLYKSIQNQQHDSIVTYQQYMILDVWTISVKYGVAHTYPMPAANDFVQIFSIFKKVSNEFETFQGRIPFGLIDIPWSSSFKNGDLVGNYFSFFCAINCVDIDTLVSKMSLLSVADTKKQFIKFGIGKSENWNTVLLNNYLKLILKDYSETYIYLSGTTNRYCVPLKRKYLMSG